MQGAVQTSHIVTSADTRHLACSFQARAVGRVPAPPGKLADPSQFWKAAAAKAALDLKQQGWAVVEGVIPREQCRDYTSRMMQWLEALGTGFSREDPDTWRAPCLPRTFNGILTDLEISHQDFVWKVRSAPAVVQVFEELWGTNELLVSFDSVNICAPGFEGSKPWLHTDQRPAVEGLACVQGLINLVDVSAATTGSLQVKTGSHEGHRDFFRNASAVPLQEQAQMKDDFYLYKPSELGYFDKYETVALEGGAGSLFLWDSRTAHMNACSPPTTQFRHVVYVCMQPRALASETDLALKQEAWRRFLCTTHWPAQNVKLHMSGTQYFGGDEGAPLIEVESLRTRERVESPAVRRLAGVEAYPRVWRRPALLTLSEKELIAKTAGAP